MSEYPEINGKPAAKIHVHAEEKIGLPNYSNVVIGSSITRYVEDTEDMQPALRRAADDVESFLAEERASVLQMVQGG